jgi:hypothetical protein
MSVWYALLSGPQEDVVHVKRLLPNSNFVFDEIDGKFALSAPTFNWCTDKEGIVDASTELLAAINTSLRLSVKTYTGFELHGLAERHADGTLHRTMFARGGAYGIAGAAAVAIAGTIGKPVRSREERIVSLLQRNPAITDVATAMTTRPITWAAMNTAFESVKGLMSTKASPRDRRADHQGLILDQYRAGK